MCAKERENKGNTLHKRSSRKMQDGPPTNKEWWLINTKVNNNSSSDNVTWSYHEICIAFKVLRAVQLSKIYSVYRQKPLAKNVDTIIKFIFESLISSEDTRELSWDHQTKIYIYIFFFKKKKKPSNSPVVFLAFLRVL